MSEIETFESHPSIAVGNSPNIQLSLASYLGIFREQFSSRPQHCDLTRPHQPLYPVLSSPNLLREEGIMKYTTLLGVSIFVLAGLPMIAAGQAPPAVVSVSTE